MQKTAIALLAASMLMVLFAYIFGGTTLVFEGLAQALKTARQALLMIFMAFIVIGQLQMLVSYGMIKNWLQKFSGNKGIVLSAIAGGIFPGGPYIFYPFLVGFKGKGIPFYLLFSFVVGKQGYDFTRLPLEISLISPWLALLRNIITLPVPIILGLVSKKFFPQSVIGIGWEGEEMQ